MKFKILFALVFSLVIAVVIYKHLGASSKKGELILFGFPEFDYAQFQEASRISEIDFKRADNLSEALEASSKKDVLLLRTMGRSFSKDEENAFSSARNKGLRVVDLFPISQDALTNVNKKIAAEMIEYYHRGGLDNYVGLFKFVGKRLLKAKADYPQPIKIPTEGLFSGDGKFFASYEEYTKYFKDKISKNQDKPKVALVAVNIIPQNIYNQRLLKFIIERLEKNGCLVYPVMGVNFDFRRALLAKIKPDVIVCAAHGKIFPPAKAKELSEGFDAPIILSVNLLSLFSDWSESKDNINSPWMAQSLVIPELDGAIEPIVVSALGEISGGNSLRKTNLALKPIEERVEKLAKRVYRWAELRKKANKDKKVAVIFYTEQGKSSSNLSGLDLAPSLFNFLRELKNNGFNTGDLPPTKEKFYSLLKQNCPVFGEWAKGAKERFFKGSNNLVKISGKDFLKWCQSNLNGELQDALLAAYPKDNYNEIVFPALKFGNVVIFPLAQATSAVESAMTAHNISGAPAINFCAQYLWVKEAFKADALIHFGTHGSLEFLEGKDVFLSQSDWTDALIADLPNGYVYIVDDPAEALIAKRRSLAVILSHLTPMFAEAELYADLKNLAQDMHSYLLSDNQALKQGYLEKVRKGLIENKLDKLLSLDELNKRPLKDAELRFVHDRFHALSKELIPMGLHVYGDLPAQEEIAEMIYCMSKNALNQNLKPNLNAAKSLDCQGEEQIKPLALELILNVLNGRNSKEILKKYANRERLAPVLDNIKQNIDRIEASQNEIAAGVKFLEGKFISPSPGGDSIFNPDVLPTGKNLYGINPESVPTRAALLAGEKTAQQIKTRFEREENKPLEKIAFTLWGVNTVMDQGITEAQILWFLGARPIYTLANNCVDVELIGLNELRRPRIDVIVQVSGEYRDIFGSRLKLIDKAIRLAAEEKSDAGDNFVRKHTLEIEKDLQGEGVSADDAKKLSLGRIFGPQEGSYAIGARSLYKNTSLWETETDIARSYINNMSGLYSSNSWGKLESSLFEKVARNADVIMQSRSMKRIGGPLSLDHTYEFAGGLNIAVRSLSGGRSAKIYFSDNRDLNTPEIISLKEAIVNEALSVMFNPKFIESLMKSKASGAAELKNYIENLYGWQITSPEDVNAELWQKTFEIYFKDKYKIGLDKFLSENNPFVYEDMASVMLDAIRKGYWNAGPLVKKDLAKVFANLITVHGPSCSERLCANTALLDYLEKYLQSSKDILNKNELTCYLDNIKATLFDKKNTPGGSLKVDLGVIHILKKD